MEFPVLFLKAYAYFILLLEDLYLLVKYLFPMKLLRDVYTKS